MTLPLNTAPSSPIVDSIGTEAGGIAWPRASMTFETVN
jgi:hypothetical protein